jgi:hypothetical protein
VASAAVLALSAGVLCLGVTAPASASAPATARTTASATSAATVLVSATAPTVWGNPDDLEVYAGEQASFSAYADGGTPQWQESSDGGDTWTDVGEALDSYDVTAAYAQNGHLFRVGYTDAGETSYSTDATLTVLAGEPTVVEQPEAAYVASGTPVTFTSRATGDPTPTQQWQVSSDGADFTDLPGATGASYTLTPTVADSDHYYRSVFSSDGGTVESDLAYLSVDAAAPTVTTQPESTTVAAGTDAVLTAHASGDPAPTVQWQVQSTDRDSDWEDIEGATQDTYTVSAPTLQVSGYAYRAVFTNDAGVTESDPALLTVTGTAPSAPLGVTATQTGTGEVTVTWDAPDSAGDSAITSYFPGYSAGQMGDGTIVGPGVRQYVFTDLATGRYTFSVSAGNLAGPGARGEAGPSILVLGASPSVSHTSYALTSGQRLTVTGLARPGSKVTLERSLPGQAFRTLATLTASSSGRYSYSYVASSTATFRARTGGGPPSDAQTAEVASRVTSAARRNAARTYTLSGSVSPAVANQLVRVYQKSGNSYTLIGSDRTDSRGRWTTRHHYASSRTYTLKAVAAATRSNVAGEVVRNVAVR